MLILFGLSSSARGLAYFDFCTHVPDISLCSLKGRSKTSLEVDILVRGFGFELFLCSDSFDLAHHST
jgi:hypothetical protein